MKEKTDQGVVEAARDRVERFADGLIPSGLRRCREQVQYLVVGGWNTLFGYAVFALLYSLFHERIHVDIILLCSYAVGVANNYVTYKAIVFRTREAGWGELPRFVLVYGLTLAANLLVLPLALRYLQMNAYVVQALFLIVVVVASYAANRYYSFRRHSDGPG